jgi:phosphoribosylformylglycinamidine cyclo-ligase
VHAAAHVTGGGFPDNVGRAVPETLAAELDLSAWQPPPVFAWLHGLGVAHDELLRTFNCGLGMVVVMDAEHVAKNLTVIEKAGQTARVVGTVAPRDGGGGVRYRGALGL